MALTVSAEIEARLLASSGEAPVWTNGELYRDNEGLARSNDRLKEENTALREQNKDYALLRKVFGSRRIDDLVAQAREAQQAKPRQRQRSYDYER